MEKKRRADPFQVLEECEQASILYAQGMMALEEGNTEQALQIFQESVGWEPHFQTYERMYICCLRLGREVEAFEALRMACFCNPRCSKTAYNYAILLKRHGDVTQAKAIARDIARRDPRYHVREIEHLLCLPEE